jgi:hypothetical protein
LTSGGVIANRLLFYGDRDNSIIGGLTATRNGSTVYVGVQLGTAYSSYTISMSKILVK